MVPLKAVALIVLDDDDSVEEQEFPACKKAKFGLLPPQQEAMLLRSMQSRDPWLDSEECSEESSTFQCHDVAKSPPQPPKPPRSLQALSLIHI